MTAAAVIIPHYRDPVRLRRCLAALVPQASADIELVVVDNESGLDLAALIAEFPTVRFLTEPARGAAAARNRGVHATTAERLLFLDADCVPAPDWITTARALPDTAELVGGRIDLFDETPHPRSGAQVFEHVFAFRQRHYVERLGFSVTANLVTRRAIFIAAGEFAPGVSEDLDWCRRATASGYRIVYDDRLRVAHPTRSDWPALAAKWRRLTEQAFALTAPGARARLGWGVRAFGVLASIVPHGWRLLRSDRIAGAGERLRGLATLVRLRMRRTGWMLRQAATGTAQLDVTTIRPRP